MQSIASLEEKSSAKRKLCWFKKKMFILFHFAKKKKFWEKSFFTLLVPWENREKVKKKKYGKYFDMKKKNPCFLICPVFENGLGMKVFSFLEISRKRLLQLKK